VSARSFEVFGEGSIYDLGGLDCLDLASAFAFRRRALGPRVIGRNFDQDDFAVK
jgi:hypothetical protein